jgi:hypothetical protein
MRVKFKEQHQTHIHARFSGAGMAAGGAGMAAGGAGMAAGDLRDD